MKNLQHIKAVKTWFVNLSRREQFMVGAAAVLVPVYLIVMLLVMPMRQEYRTLTQRLHKQKQDNSSIRLQLSEIEQALIHSPNVRQREDIARLRRQLEHMHAEVGVQLEALVAPEEMPIILRRLLRNHPGLTLLNMVNAPPQEIQALETSSVEEDRGAGNAEPERASEPAGIEALYRHPLQIELSGSYLDALAYMEKLRSWTEHMFIDSVEICGDEYPHTRIKLQVSTISTGADLLRGHVSAPNVSAPTAQEMM